MDYAVNINLKGGGTATISVCQRAKGKVASTRQEVAKSTAENVIGKASLVASNHISKSLIIAGNRKQEYFCGEVRRNQASFSC